MAHFQAAWDQLRPWCSNLRTPNDLSHYRLHEFPSLQKGIFWFRSSVVFQCSGLVWYVSFSSSYIPQYSNPEIKEKSSKETFELHFCGGSSIVENIPTALNTDVRCSPEVTKLSQRRQHVDNFSYSSVAKKPEKEAPNHVAAYVQYSGDIIQCMQKCKALHSLAFLKPISCAFWQ